MVVSPLINDSDPDNQSLRLLNWGSVTPKLGTLTAVNGSTGSFMYTPKTEAEGTDTFNYVVSDGSATASGLVTVNIGKGREGGGALRYL